MDDLSTRGNVRKHAVFDLIPFAGYTDSSTLNWRIDKHVVYAISLAQLNFRFIGIWLALRGKSRRYLKLRYSN